MTDGGARPNQKTTTRTHIHPIHIHTNVIGESRHSAFDEALRPKFLSVQSSAANMETPRVGSGDSSSRQPPFTVPAPAPAAPAPANLGFPQSQTVTVGNVIRTKVNIGAGVAAGRLSPLWSSDRINEVKYVNVSLGGIRVVREEARGRPPQNRTGGRGQGNRGVGLFLLRVAGV